MLDHAEVLLKYKKISDSVVKANKALGSSVVYNREDILVEAFNCFAQKPEAELYLVGVKNTDQIRRETIERICKNEHFLFHTVDAMSERGRAIDTNLINPLTGRIMTGSSSGGCYNILKGINDIAIGTDGGGSVLAPAISSNLCSIMAKGLGLKGHQVKRSTDAISFIAGIGVISYDFTLCKAVVNQLVVGEKENKRLRVLIPNANNIILPNNKDMADYINQFTSYFINEVEFIREDYPKFIKRQDSIQFCKEKFAEGYDLILTAEGPIDVFGTGDSVLGTWGSTGSRLQNNSGKYLIKIVNMINGTAVSIPTEDLGVSIVVIAPEGIKEGFNAISFSERLNEYYRNKRPELYYNYFFNGHKKLNKGFL